MHYYARVKEIVKELKIFERNKVPLEIKVLGIATYIQTSSVRRKRNPLVRPCESFIEVMKLDRNIRWEVNFNL